MKVAIDASPLSSGHKVRGVGKYTKNLITSLQLLAKKDFSIEPIEFDLLKNEDLSKFDIIHYPYFDLFFMTLPSSRPTKTVVTIHDVIPLLYPDHYPPGIRGKVKFSLQRRALSSVDAVITDTETSKKDIVRFLNYPDEKIFPIYLAPAHEFKRLSPALIQKVSKKYNLPKRFVLYIGDINYNKNVASLAKACIKLNFPLVIIGKQAADLVTQRYKAQLSGGIKDQARYLLGINHPQLAHYTELEGLFEKHKKLIYRLGYVEDTDFNAVLGLATVYCQPSLYEGFGLPVLEAMQAGIPVVASRTQALVEIAGEAALFVDKADAEGFAEAISRVIASNKLSKELVKLGYKKVREYSWQKTALETYEVYQQVYKGL